MNVVMNPALVSRIVSSIPERALRRLTGTVFDLDGARACSDPARLARIVPLLQWLAPITPLTQDEQRELGVHGGAMRAEAIDPADEISAEEEPLAAEESLF
jgi:hypothetical protein